MPDEARAATSQQGLVERVKDVNLQHDYTLSAQFTRELVHTNTEVSGGGLRRGCGFFCSHTCSVLVTRRLTSMRLEARPQLQYHTFSY